MSKEKVILLVVAFHNYQPIEYGDTKQVLASAGLLVKTASDQMGTATTKDGSTTSVDIVLSDVNPADYAGVFFIGGPGALEHLDTQESNRILNEAMLAQMPYGAICIAPRILAKANVLTGKKATGWDDDGKLAEIFAQNNVEYVREPVVVDGNVVTANGPGAAREFGEAIAHLLVRL